MLFLSNASLKIQQGNYNVLVGLLLIAFTQGLVAQKNYGLQWRTDLSVTGIILASNLTGLAIGQHIEPLSAAKIASLDRKNVNVLDRPATYWLHGKEDRASNVVLKGATIAPVVLLAFKKIRKEAVVISVLYLETFTLTLGLTQLTKNLVKRSRPYAYNPEASQESRQQVDARRSFFSGHTSSTATSCFFAAKVWTDLHPDSPWKPAVWSAAATIPAVMGLLRMRAGRHFFTDVAAGYAVGAAVGWLVPELHKSTRLQQKRLTFYGTQRGAGLVWCFAGGSSGE
jgi:membrane-associated phospholipid phosphatase